MVTRDERQRHHYGIGVIVRGSSAAIRTRYGQRLIELAGLVTGIGPVPGESYFERYVLNATFPVDEMPGFLTVLIAIDAQAGASIKSDARVVAFAPAVLRSVDYGGVVFADDAAREADLKRRMVAEYGIDRAWIVYDTTVTSGDLLSKFTPL